jgi:hypothetical protein
MKYHGFTASVALVAALLLVSGILQGRMTNRWDRPANLKTAAARLEQFASDIGPWKLQKKVEMDPGAVEMLQCEGYLDRVYVNSETGQTASLAVIVGPPGPIAVHTPDICYSGAGYTSLGPRQLVELVQANKTAESKQTLEKGPAKETAWLQKLRSNDVRREELHVYYGWSDGGRWDAAANPRVTFAGRPLLYKFQLAVNQTTSAGTTDSDSGKEFLEFFLPAIEPCIKPPPDARKN